MLQTRWRTASKSWAEAHSTTVEPSTSELGPPPPTSCHHRHLHQCSGSNAEANVGFQTCCCCEQARELELSADSESESQRESSESRAKRRRQHCLVRTSMSRDVIVPNSEAAFSDGEKKTLSACSGRAVLAISTVIACKCPFEAYFVVDC